MYSCPARQMCLYDIVLVERFVLAILEVNNNYYYYIENKLSKANIVDASLDVCKHWPADQSQRSISEISSAKFRKIDHVLNCEIKFPNVFLSKVD